MICMLTPDGWAATGKMSPPSCTKCNQGLVYQLHNQLILLHYDHTALTRVQQHSIPWWCHMSVTILHLAVTSTAAGWRHWNFCYLKVDVHAFRASTLLDGRQDGQSARKKWVVGYWHGYLSEARCRWFAYGPVDATATPSSLPPVKSKMVYLSGAGLPRLSWKKGINGCSSISSSKGRRN